MKKTISIVLALVFALSLCVVPTFAATPADKVASSVKAAIPSAYKNLFEATIDNIIKQIDISEEQANQIIALIDETKATVKDEGHTLHLYSVKEDSYLLAQFDKACKILNVTYKYVLKKNAVHEGDVICDIYYNGVKIGSLDGDISVKTTGADVNGNVVVLSVVAGIALLAAAAFVFKKSAADAQ